MLHAFHSVSTSDTNNMVTVVIHTYVRTYTHVLTTCLLLLSQGRSLWPQELVVAEEVGDRESEG